MSCTLNLFDEWHLELQRACFRFTTEAKPAMRFVEIVRLACGRTRVVGKEIQDSHSHLWLQQFGCKKNPQHLLEFVAVMEYRDHRLWIGCDDLVTVLRLTDKIKNIWVEEGPGSTLDHPVTPMTKTKMDKETNKQWGERLVITVKSKPIQ